MIAACITIAVLILAAGVVGVAVVARSVVRDILGFERERLISRDTDAIAKRLAKVEQEQKADRTRLEKFELGRHVR